MRCNKLTWLYITLFLFLTIQFVYATTNWHFPKPINIPSDKKWHFGNVWFQSIGTSMQITSYFEDNWLNYSCSGGTQNLYNNNIKPFKVYFNNIEQIEGENWTYSGGTVIITPSGTNVSVSWASQESAVYSAYASQWLIYGDNFTLEFEVLSSLSLQSEYDFRIEVKTGTLNGTNASLQVASRYGTLIFDSQDNTTIEFKSITAPQGFKLETEGVESTTDTGNRTFQSVIKSGNNIIINWRWNRLNVLDQYFMFGVGMLGIAMMIFAPTYIGLGIVKNAYSTETGKRVGYAMLSFIIGFGLTVCWLWPGGG